MSEQEKIICKFCGSEDDKCLWFENNDDFEAPCGATSIEDNEQNNPR